MAGLPKYFSAAEPLIVTSMALVGVSVFTSIAKSNFCPIRNLALSIGMIEMADGSGDV